jgi:two-component system response regulator
VIVKDFMANVKDRGGDRAPVLLVEDNLDDERLVVRAFRKAGIDEFVVARTGEEALNMLNDGSAQYPSLVLLDLKLPKVNGLEVLKAMRAKEETKLVPVVVFTSSDEEPDISQSYDLGANSYIRKPVDYESFMEAVQAVIVYWLNLNKAAPSATGVAAK